MKRTWIVLPAGLALLLLGSATDSAAQAKKLKAAIVLPGVITDKAWNELGLQRDQDDREGAGRGDRVRREGRPA